MMKIVENQTFDTERVLYGSDGVLVKDCTFDGPVDGEGAFKEGRNIETQPLCYCKNLKLTDCEMLLADLAFEKSEVEAVITTKVESIKNPLSGRIQVPVLGELIRDDPDMIGEAVVGGQIK